MNDDVTLMLGDCLERMGEIADGSVDLVLADLPYAKTDCEWDSIIPLGPLWNQYRRLLSPSGAAVFTAAQPFTTRLIASNFRMFKYCDVWEKTRPSGAVNCNVRPLRIHEDIVVFARGRLVYHPQMRPAVLRVETEQVIKPHPAICATARRRKFDNRGVAYPQSIVRFANPNHENIHPTQKPVPLFEYLIRTYSNPGDLVLDNSCGSGTTIIAALNTDRRCIGIEKDPAIFATASARIAEHRASMPLLAGVAS